MRKFYWYLSAYVRKHGWIFLLSLIGAVVIFSVIIPRVSSNLNIKPRTFIGIVGLYSITNLPEEISTQISAGLTQITADGSVLPLLATQWTVDEDTSTYTFTLRPEIFWQDGQALDPADITYSYPDVVITTTPDQIQYELPSPFSPFPSVVSEPLLRYETKRNLLGKKIAVIGIGSNKLVSYTQKLDKLDEVIIDTPTQRKIYRFFPTEQEAITSFKLGTIDQISGLSQPYGLDQWQTVEVTQTSDEQTHVVVFFDTANPLFQTNVRQALAYGVEKTDFGTRALGPLSPTSWAFLPGLKSFKYDKERAIERLLSQVPPSKIVFTLESSPQFASTAETLINRWQDLGTKAVAACQVSKEITDKTLCDRYAIAVALRFNNFPDTQNFEALLAAQKIPKDPDQYSLWHSEQPTNFSHYKNTRIDKLLEEGRQTIEQQRRKEIYQEFQQFFVEDVPALFLYYLPSYQVIRK